ncbi:MAG: hypothetical protein JWO03_2872 [Bacteroidetes bacterium]|nr:hypothetical protein [Bacteroidota bacterium]
MLTVNLGNQTFAVPTSWNEVIRSGRYLEVIQILAFSPAGDTEGNRADILERIMRLYADGALEATDVAPGHVPSAAMMLIDECYPALAFIFDDYCIDPPMAKIRHKGITYTSKGPRMLPMTGREMEDCAWAYAEWIKTGDIVMLDNIIAHLYRPKWIWMRHWPFRTMAKKNLAELPSMTKLGIKFWYESTEAWWKFMYRSLYEGDSASQRAPDSLAVSRIIRAIAGPKRGDVDKVRTLDRDEIMFELAELEREREEAEK